MKWTACSYKSKISSKMTYVVALVLYHSLGVYVGLISPPFAWQSPLLSVVVRALASSEASLAHSLRSVYGARYSDEYHVQILNLRPPKIFPADPSKFSQPTQANFLTVERMVQTDRQKFPCCTDYVGLAQARPNYYM